MKKSFQFSAKPQCVTPLLITHSILGYQINHLKVNMHALSSRCSLLINVNISDNVSTLFCINVMNKSYSEFWLCLSTYAQITKTPSERSEQGRCFSPPAEYERGRVKKKCRAAPML